MKQTAMLMFLAVPVLVMAGSGFAPLKIAVGPRVVAMGEAGAGYIDDASALFYNPAGLANVPTYSALFAHNQGFLDMNQEYVAGAYCSKGLGGVGLALDYWGSGSIQGVNMRGETIPGYVFSAADWSLDIGYGRSFSDLSVGLGFKLVREQHESTSTSAMAVDAGAMYKTPLEGLKLGISALNIGTKGMLVKESYSLPMEGRLGWRYDQSIIGATMDVIFSGEGIGTQSDTSAGAVASPLLGIAAGIECRPVDIMAIRVGYRTGSDYDGVSGLRAGLGVSWHGIGVDYAYAPYGKLGATHRIALSYHGAAQESETGESE